MAVFAVALALVVAFVFEYVKGRRTDYLMLTGVCFFGVASAVFVPHFVGVTGGPGAYGTALLMALLAPVVLFLLCHGVPRVSARRLAYPVALVGLGAVAAGIFYAIDPGMFRMLLSRFGMLGAGAAHILETHPLLVGQEGELTLGLAWSNYTTAFFIAPLGLLVLGIVVARQGDTSKLVFLVWAVTTLGAGLAMRRFGDYFVISSALLTGYASFLFVQWIVGRRLTGDGGRSRAREKKRKKRDRRTQGGGVPWLRKGHVPILVMSLVVFMVVFFPNMGRAKALASGSSMLDDAWYESMLWMRENTPEPLGDADAYYESYPTPYSYPESAYGVLSWWDYGYWITQLAHRIPNANPGQGGAARVAEFLVAQDEATAEERAEKLGSKYVVLDRSTVHGKFYAVVEWAGKPEKELWCLYYGKIQGEMRPAARYLHPAYFRCMAVRLYNFDGQAAQPGGDHRVIRWEKRTTEEGETVRLMVDSWEFDSYEEMEAFVEEQESGNFQIVSEDPFVSPVPVEALEGYRPVYESSQRAGGVPKVKVFEYTGD